MSRSALCCRFKAAYRQTGTWLGLSWPGLPSFPPSYSVPAVLKLIAHVLMAMMLVFASGISAFAHSTPGAEPAPAAVACMQKACAGHARAPHASAAPVALQCAVSSCAAQGINLLGETVPWPAVSGLGPISVHREPVPSGIVLDRDSPPPKSITPI